MIWQSASETLSLRPQQNGRLEATIEGQAGKTADLITADKLLLIVDDDPQICSILVRYLIPQGYKCVQAGSGEEALEILRTNTVDAVLSDVRMPQMGGIELLSKIKALDESIAVLMISGDFEMEQAAEAMRLGADDCILKPFSCNQVLLGLERALSRSDLRTKIRRHTEELKIKVVETTARLNRLFLNVVHSLVQTLEAKDPCTNGHSRRVTWYSLRLGRAAGLEGHDLEIIELGGMLHDLGKIGIREDILQKAEALTRDEYKHVMAHPEIGVKILSPLQEFQEVLPIVRHHHERYDGTGYPSHLGGEDIPLFAKIVSVADAYDAMTSGRPYRSALSSDEAVSRLKAASGTQLDPYLVDIFLPLVA